MALETIRESRTAKTVGTRTKKKKEKGVIYKLERLYDEATDIAASTGEVILDVYNRLKKKMNLNEGGMPSKRTGSIDYRKGGMVMRTTDNRKNKI